MTTTDHSYYRPSSFYSLMIAVLVLAAAVLALSQLPELVKQLGEPLLYLPAQFGLVQQVSWTEVHVIDPFEASPQLLILPHPGRYAIYTDDEQLLEDSNALVDKQGSPWLVVKSTQDDAEVAVAFVERGLRPYDTPLAKGRPIFTFVVDTPGRYMLDPPQRDGVITVVPDYTTGKETTILLLVLLQLSIVGTIAGVVIYIRTEPLRMRRQIQADIAAERRVQGEAFWQNEIRRSKDAGKSPD
jgi:hypothetical protein